MVAAAPLEIHSASGAGGWRCSDGLGPLARCQGELSKQFDARDGLGIRLLQQVELHIAFLSGG